MKNIYLLLICLGISTLGLAQDFIYSPSKHVSDTIYEGAGGSLDIYIENTDSNDITYKWELVSNNIPESWFTSLCDFPNCFAGIPDSGTMTPIVAAAQDSIQGFFKLTISAATADTVLVELYVYDALDIDRGDTVSFGFVALPDTTDTSTGLNPILPDAITLYPNPTTNQLTVSGNGVTQLDIYNVSGSIVRQEQFKSSNSVQLDVNELVPGHYFLRVESADGILRRSFVKL